LGLLTCKNRLPYNLYCVGGDVKHCTIQSILDNAYLCTNINMQQQLFLNQQHEVLVVGSCYLIGILECFVVSWF